MVQPRALGRLLRPLPGAGPLLYPTSTSESPCICSFQAAQRWWAQARATGCIFQSSLRTFWGSGSIVAGTAPKSVDITHVKSGRHVGRLGAATGLFLSKSGQSWPDFILMRPNLDQKSPQIGHKLRPAPAEFRSSSGKFGSISADLQDFEQRVITTLVQLLRHTSPCLRMCGCDCKLVQVAPCDCHGSACGRIIVLRLSSTSLRPRLRRTCASDSAPQRVQAQAGYRAPTQGFELRAALRLPYIFRYIRPLSPSACRALGPHMTRLLLHCGHLCPPTHRRV